MANAIYNKAKYKWMAPGTLGTSQGDSIDLLDDTIKVALIDTGTYTFSQSDEYWSSASSAAVGTPVTLASKTVTNNVFDAADPTFTAVTGTTAEAFIIYKDTGSAATSPLIYFCDTAATGLPVTPNGGDIVINFNASGIFAL